MIVVFLLKSGNAQFIRSSLVGAIHTFLNGFLVVELMILVICSWIAVALSFSLFSEFLFVGGLLVVLYFCGYVICWIKICVKWPLHCHLSINFIFLLGSHHPLFEMMEVVTFLSIILIGSFVLEEGFKNLGPQSIWGIQVQFIFSTSYVLDLPHSQDLGAWFFLSLEGKNPQESYILCWEGFAWDNEQPFCCVAFLMNATRRIPTMYHGPWGFQNASALGSPEFLWTCFGS